MLNKKFHQSESQDDQIANSVGNSCLHEALRNWVGQSNNIEINHKTCYTIHYYYKDS